jgi:uncharacterized membrane protein YphA (DoxX/SURF4 family)
MLDVHLEKPWWILRLTYGLVPIVAGLDKFTNLLTDWTQYLSPLAQRVIPFSGQTFMYLVGIIEIAAGILVLTKYTRIGAYVVSAWLLAIVVNLLLSGHYFDIAVRDLVMSIGAFALAKMTEVREGVPAIRGERRTRLETSEVGV